MSPAILATPRVLWASLLVSTLGMAAAACFLPFAPPGQAPGAPVEVALALTAAGCGLFSVVMPRRMYLAAVVRAQLRVVSQPMASAPTGDYRDAAPTEAVFAERREEVAR